jgi:hypothetical protein
MQSGAENREVTMEQFFDTAKDVIAYVGIGLFLYSVARSMSRIAQSLAQSVHRGSGIARD